MPPLKFLSDEDVKAMHEATLQVLNEAGVFWTHKPSLEVLQDAGCTVKDNRVFFPPDLVMDSIAKAGKRPVIRGRNGQVNELGGGGLYSSAADYARFSEAFYTEVHRLLEGTQDATAAARNLQARLEELLAESLIELAETRSIARAYPTV